MQNRNAHSVYISCRTFRTADWLFSYVPRSTNRLSTLGSSDRHTVFSAFLAWGTPPVFGHRKSLRRISPTKAAFVLFLYCNYNTLVFNSQRDNVGHLLCLMHCHASGEPSFRSHPSLLLSVSMSFYECSDSEAPSAHHGFQSCLSLCERPF